jgi:hypothetical protein
MAVREWRVLLCRRGELSAAPFPSPARSLPRLVSSPPRSCVRVFVLVCSNES